GHAGRMGRVLAIKLGRRYQASADMDTGFAFDAPAEVDVALLRAIVRGERAGDADYQRWADHEPDPGVAHLLRVSGSEESRHADRLAQAIALLEADG
nr:hypothetical protein [Micromonospora sp. DSM 115978]